MGEPSGQRETIMTAWEEPKELDTDNEAVISLYDGIRKILDKQSSPKQKQETKIPRAARHILQCGRILKVDIERKLVVVTIMKSDGELHELRIQANDHCITGSTLRSTVWKRRTTLLSYLGLPV